MCARLVKRVGEFVDVNLDVDVCVGEYGIALSCKHALHVSRTFVTKYDEPFFWL